MGYDQIFLDWITNEYGGIVTVHNYETVEEMINKGKKIYYPLFSDRSHIEIFKNTPKDVITVVGMNAIKNFNGLKFVGSLSNLAHLAIRNSTLNEWPSSISGLYDLTILDISFNNLKELPGFICNLSKLTYLNLDFNNLTELPCPIGSLSNLTTLLITGNGLNELPEFIGNLSKLATLALSGNELTELPESIGRLSKLGSLSVSNNELSELPASIGGLSKLTHLDASFNNISELPESIGRLSNLAFLGLNNNKLKKLPDFFVKLPKLEVLDISRNNLNGLTGRFIGGLSNLTHLSLNFNNITELPDFIGGLSNLTFLGASNNNLKELPDFIGGLSNLAFLDVSSNNIKELPSSIGSLNKLTFLDLSNLSLSIIPRAVTDLGLPFTLAGNAPTMGGVRLYNTKLLNMDISLFEQPLPIIKDFYDNITEINECKLIFLGEGEVGKTSIIERMVHPEYEIVKNRPPTNGIRIEKYTKKISGKEINLRIWDFGGQEIMHTMHKCFMTSRTTYVIVLDARKNQFLTKYALYWLDTIETFAPGSPIILVINKIDLNEDTALNESALKEKYPSLRLPVVRTSYYKNKGFDGLEGIIDDTILNSSGYKYYFNKKWLPIKEKLENMSQPYIEKSALFKKSGLGGHTIQESLLKYFKDIGISYYYQGENITFRSKNIAVLNPEWLTGGIYRLITNAPRNNALIPRSTIKSILSKINPNDVNKTYTYKEDDEIDFVLDVMRQFEISHKYKNFEFVLLKLPKTRPEKAAGFEKKSTLHISWNADYLPFNVIHRLMVKFFDDIDFDCIWLYGALFKNSSSKKSSLIYMNINEQQIDAFVNAEGPFEQKEYLSVIRKKLHMILEQLNINKYRENIHYTIDGETGKVDYFDVLKQFYNRPNNEIFLRETGHYCLPGKLLYTVYTEKDVRGDLIMQFGDNTNFENSVFNLTQGDDNAIDISQSNETIKPEELANRLPTEETITESQVDDFLSLIREFLDSEYTDDLNFKDIKPLQTIISESEIQEVDKKGIWSEIRSFFTENVTKIPQAVASFALFVENNPTVVSWVKDLFTTIV